VPYLIEKDRAGMGRIRLLWKGNWFLERGLPKALSKIKLGPCQVFSRDAIELLLDIVSTSGQKVATIS